jgi:hypothetical protein
VPAGRRARFLGRTPALWLAAGVVLLTGCEAPDEGSASAGATESYEGRLFSPTFLAKLGAAYFLVDAWHHRILTSPVLERAIADWTVIDDDLAGPHSLASDGTYLVAEDTGRHRVKIYRRDGQGTWAVHQVVSAVGRRPHRVVYRAELDRFLVLGSEDQTMYFIGQRNGFFAVDRVEPLPFLSGAYTRSFSVIGDHYYFVSGPGRIAVTTLLPAGFRLDRTHLVPPAWRNMNDLVRVGEYFYFTASYDRIGRARSLDDLSRGQYERLYGPLGFRGNPYYLTVIDGRLYVPENTSYSSVVSFRPLGDEVVDIERHFDAGAPRKEDRARMEELPR